MSLFDVYAQYDISPVRGNGVYVYDNKNTPYLDLYGGHAVISLGHSHPSYVNALKTQLDKIAFYSNAIKNLLQERLGEVLPKESRCEDYQLFMCNSGAEANENALKLASFHTKRKRIIAFKNSFHGRTSAAVAVTDNVGIQAPINKQHQVTFLEFGEIDHLEKELSKKDVCAVIFETIQGVGGLDEFDAHFYKSIERLSKQYGTLLIADEVQSGFGRSGDFFAFQKHKITPHIISMAKGMGNGFPVGGILIHPSIKASKGLLGTTFGGNYLACVATLSVLEVMKEERLTQNANTIGEYIKSLNFPNQVKKIKGRGLIIGLEFEDDVSQLRKELLYKKQIFTGGSNKKNILRILPPLSVRKKHIDIFLKALFEVC